MTDEYKQGLLRAYGMVSAAVKTVIDTEFTELYGYKKGLAESIEAEMRYQIAREIERAEAGSLTSATTLILSL